MNNPLFIGTSNTHGTLWDRLEKGLCTDTSCDGKLMSHGLDTMEHECPKWIIELNRKAGYATSSDPITVTTYHYHCIVCGRVLDSTKFIENALSN